MTEPTPQRQTGTKEWAGKNVNIFYGCKHGCRYCWARTFHHRYGHIESLEDFDTPRRKQDVIDKNWKLSTQRFMYPSTHDLMPEDIELHIHVLGKILRPGNRVLIVSKPHLDSIVRLCDALAEYKHSIMFRFSIGARNQEILNFWEPNAPSFQERLSSLKHAYDLGFRTSVSSEPLLDAADAEGLVGEIDPYVSHTIWIGPLDYINDGWASPEEIRRIRDSQTPRFVREHLYPLLNGNPKIRWKHRYSDLLGLPPSIDNW